jgi:hypothetical protein
MYFAVNPWPPGTPERLLAALQQAGAQASASGYAYVLLDASFDQSLPTAFPWRRHVECSLYDDTPLNGLKTAAPVLLSLPDAPETQLTWLHELAGQCAGKPMLSLLHSALPAATLAAHLRPYLRARTKDSLEWPVRWADTRVLPALIATMTPTERTHLLAPLQAWITTDRQGEIIQWQGQGNPYPEAVDFDCWPLEDSRFANLVDEAEADAVIASLHETQPDLFDAQAPASNHACVKRHLVIATQNAIAGAGARRHFAMLALCLKDDFSTHPALLHLLKRIRAGADYQTEVAALPAEFWEQCAKETA